METLSNRCLYLNPETSNASEMNKPCINGTDDIAWPCWGKEFINTSIQQRNLERPTGDNISSALPFTPAPGQKTTTQKPPAQKPPAQTNGATQAKDPGTEGFTNMGETYVRPGDCPDGYRYCDISKECVKVCMNCKYNERTYGKSKEFNEYDMCFPTRGVYDGLDEMGNTKCTCGNNNQYCGDNFDAQGGFTSDNIFILNVGNISSLEGLASY